MYNIFQNAVPLSQGELLGEFEGRNSYSPTPMRGRDLVGEIGGEISNFHLGEIFDQSESLL